MYILSSILEGLTALGEEVLFVVTEVHVVYPVFACAMISLKNAQRRNVFNSVLECDVLTAPASTLQAMRWTGNASPYETL